MTVSPSSNALGLLPYEAYAERRASCIRENPNAEFSANELPVIAEYLERLSIAYRGVIEQLASSAPPMRPTTELVIIVPAYHESASIHRALTAYAQMIDLEVTEIVLFENHNADQGRDDTPGTMRYWSARLPHVNIVHLYNVFACKPPIGAVRKYATDIVILRKQWAGIKRSITLVSNDADTEGIARNYAKTLVLTFRGQPLLDAVVGRMAYPHTYYKQYPILYAVQMLWEVVEILFNRSHGNVDLIGRNTAIRSGSYAAIGGYNANALVAEDLELGWLLKAARGWDKRRLRYLSNAYVINSPRRAIHALLCGQRLTEQWHDFHTNETVRRSGCIRLNVASVDFSEEQLRDQIQGLYDMYCRPRFGALGVRQAESTFARAAEFIGIRCSFAGDYVIVGDSSGLRKRLSFLSRGLP
jgi:hypothetical protein